MGETDIRWAAEPARNVRLLTVPQAAERLGIGVAKTWQMVADGRLDSLKIDSSRRIPDIAVDAYIADRIAEDQARRAGSAA